MKRTLFITFIFTISLFNFAIAEQYKIANLDLDEVTISDMHHAYKNNTLTVVQVVKSYMQRIESQNKQGPNLNAVISINPDAIEQAKELDKQLKRHKDNLPPLFGIPILVKDNIDTKDNMPTTAGSLALKNNFVNQDAFLINKIRKDGAIILAKTNLSQWANFRSENSSSGWSSIGGQTRNPYVLSRSTCGSSAGTGAAISANWGLVGIGTETDGSIICPSSANGLVGLKPTVGLISRDGIIPISHSQDTAGPMTRSVKDAAILLTSMAGKDSQDKVTLKQPASINYLKYIKKEGLKGKRIGVLSTAFNLQNDTNNIFKQALRDLTAQGAKLVMGLSIEVSEKQWNSEYEVMLFEFKAGLNSYLSNKNLEFKTLEDLIEFNKNNIKLEMPYFKQEIFVKSNAKGDLKDKDYLQALANNGAIMRKSIDALMDENNLDLIIAPSLNPAWNIDLVNGDNYTGSSSSYAAVSGYPSLTIPMGYVHSLPVGISFIGKPFQEGVIIEAAYNYEQATRHRIKPEFLPTLIE